MYPSQCTQHRDTESADSASSRRMLEARNNVGTRVAGLLAKRGKGRCGARTTRRDTSTQVGVPMSLRRLNAKAADMISAIAVSTQGLKEVFSMAASIEV